MHCEERIYGEKWGHTVQGLRNTVNSGVCPQVWRRQVYVCNTKSIRRTGIAHPLECEKRHSRTSRARFELFAWNYETILDGTSVASSVMQDR